MFSDFPVIGNFLTVDLGTVAVYGVKTVINTVDTITPDIVNKED